MQSCVGVRLPAPPPTVKVDGERLVTLVYANKELWDSARKDYYNREVCKQLWQNIANEMNLPCEAVKSKWRNMRDIFRREWIKHNAKVLSGEFEGIHIKPKWAYFEMMLFLKDVITRRNNSYNSETQFVDFSQEESSFDDQGPKYNATNVPSPVPAMEMPFSPMEDNKDIILRDASSFVSQEQFPKEQFPKEQFAKEQFPREYFHREQFAREQFRKEHFTRETPRSHSSSPRPTFPSHSTFPSPPAKKLRKGGDKEAEADRESDLVDVLKQQSRLCNDADYQFLVSLLPELRKVPECRKLQAKIKIQKILLREQMGDSGPGVRAAVKSESIAVSSDSDG